MDRRGDREQRLSHRGLGRVHELLTKLAAKQELLALELPGRVGMPRRSSTGGKPVRSAPFLPALADELRVEAVDFATALN